MDERGSVDLPDSGSPVVKWLQANSHVANISGTGMMLISFISYLISLPGILVVGILAFGSGLLAAGLIAKMAVDREAKPLTLGLSDAPELPVSPRRLEAQSETSTLVTAGPVAEPQIVAPIVAAESTPLSLNPAEIPHLGLLSMHVSGEFTGPIRGAKVTVSNEQTGREYIGHTNGGGNLQLRVPVGNYSVAFSADKYLPCTDGVRVKKEGISSHQVSLQLNESARRQRIKFNAIVILESLSELHKSGSKILSSAHSEGRTPALQAAFDAWEKQAEAFCNNSFSPAQAKLFFMQANVPPYLILLVGADHRKFLNQINARLFRLDEMRTRLQAQLDGGFLYQ